MTLKQQLFYRAHDGLFSAPQNLPESNPMRMEETRKRNMMVLQAIKDAAETDENIARSLGQRGK